MHAQLLFSVESPLPLQYIWVSLPDRQRGTRKQTSNFEFILFFILFFGKKEESTESNKVALISRKSFFFFFHAAFQVFESLKMRMLETGYASCCALWRMIF